MIKIKRIKMYRDLPKSIYILFGARIINSLGAFVYPFLTFFLTEKMGYTRELVGAFMMASAIVRIPGAMIGGKICDHFGRKKVLISFQTMAALSLIPCGFLGNSILIPYLIMISNFCNSAARPINTSIAADLTNPENRQEGFSLLYLGGNMGVAIGPLIAGFLFDNYIKWIFLGDAITTLISTMVVAFFVKETMNKEEDVDKNINVNEQAEKGSLLQVLLKRPYLIMFSSASIIYSFIYSQHSFVIPIQARELFNDYGTEVFGFVMTANALTVVFLTSVVIKLTKNFRPIFNISMAGLFYAFGFGMLYFTKSFSVLMISTVVWTIGEIIQTTNTGVYIANNTPVSHRGRMNALLPIISGMGFSIGPWLMGKYINNKQAIEAWPLIFVLGIIGSIAMLVINKGKNT